VYASPGTYDVVLTIADNADTVTLVKSAFVTVVAAPQAAFSFQETGLVVAFQNETVGGSSWLWDFGDGQGSTQENPVHTYAQEGTYEVSLSAFNEFCGSAISKGVQVVSTSIADVASGPGFSVMPNPTSGSINFISQDESCAGCRGMLRNPSGQILLQFEVAPGLNSLDIAGFPAGVYLLEVKRKGELVFVERVVKQ
jgi:PKD repeat protein